MNKVIIIILSILLLISVVCCTALAVQTNPVNNSSASTMEPAKALEATEPPATEPTVAPVTTEPPADESSGRLAAIYDSLTQSGYHVLKEDVGSGSTAFDVFVVSKNSMTATHIRVSTNEDTLLAALLKENLISGENASWGYYITTVDGFTADYDGKSEYWNIFEFDSNTQQFSSLAEAVEATQVTTDSVFMFMMTSD